jgi:hypothetical protein
LSCGRIKQATCSGNLSLQGVEPMGSFLKFGLVPDNDVFRDSKSPEAFISPDGFFIGMLGIIRNYYTKIHITLL